MPTNKQTLVTLFLFLLLLPQTAAAMEIFVSIAPQKWLVDNIGKELVSTSVLVGQGQDPHTFEPTPRQMSALSKAKIYFTLDMEFEQQLVAKLKKTMPELLFVDIARHVQKIAMTGHGEHNDHNPQMQATGHQDADETLDPHIWLSSANLKIMAGEIAEACIAADQANSGRYAANLSLLNEKLDTLHSSIAKGLAPYAGRRFFVFHPSFGYFAHDYNLHQEAVEVSGNIPSPRQLSQLISQAKEDGVKVIFVQPQFDAKSAQTVADAIDGEVVPLDALAEDVGENLEIIAGKIQSALSR